ncbi:superoxide dismutase [Cu-Zn]-like [Mytilus trossulus]|uniref:superoxide dismutase [Cu-Zn]-like n=1 Tax=Mytilus trossulus TaxID=6551 RepID=UPI0030049F78
MIKAKCVVEGTSIKGTVFFTQENSNSPVRVTGAFIGLRASVQQGFTIYEFGDITNGCLSAGEHYNPFGKTHGAPADEERHVGDLGNILASVSGKATINFTDTMISLTGPQSIIGRTVVVHGDRDDLGLGEDETSKTTGNAGSLEACGIIGIAEV